MSQSELDKIYIKLQDINKKNVEEDPQCEEVERLVFSINKRVDKVVDQLGKLKNLRQHKRVYDKIQSYTGLDVDIVEIIYHRLLHELEEVKTHLREDRVFKHIKVNWKDL